MKRKDYGTQSYKQLPGPIVLSSEHKRTGLIKTSRSIKPADDGVFYAIRKEADDTLDAFQVERIRQVNTIDNMREELRKLAGTSGRKVDYNKVMMLSDRKSESKPALIRKQSVILEEELKRTSKLLEEKEQALSKEKLENERLRKENKALKDNKENMGMLPSIKKKIIKILNDITNDDYNDKHKYEKNEGLVARLEQAVKVLIKENKSIHLKYESLLELHNNLIRKTKNNTATDKWNAANHLTIEIKTDTTKNTLAKRKDSVESNDSMQTNAQSNMDETKNLKARILRLDSSIKTLESARSIKVDAYDIYPGTTREYKTNIKLPTKKSYNPLHKY